MSKSGVKKRGLKRAACFNIFSSVPNLPGRKRDTL